MLHISYQSSTGIANGYYFFLGVGIPGFYQLNLDFDGEYGHTPESDRHGLFTYPTRIDMIFSLSF